MAVGPLTIIIFLLSMYSMYITINSKKEINAHAIFSCVNVVSTIFSLVFFIFPINDPFWVYTLFSFSAVASTCAILIINVTNGQNIYIVRSDVEIKNIAILSTIGVLSLITFGYMLQNDIYSCAGYRCGVIRLLLGQSDNFLHPYLTINISSFFMLTPVSLVISATWKFFRR